MKIHLILSVLFAFAAISSAVTQEQDAVSQNTVQIPAATPTFYHNLQYGFCFRFSADWSYYIVAESWSGTVLDAQKNESGPELLIRSREWTAEHPYQDIPIMIFTPSQWKLVEADNLSVSAAPIGPAELGRNKNYVFALPPRWIGFTEVDGQDLVQALMSQHPFQAPCEPIVYRNMQYGFCFLLPADWKGYSILTHEWSGWSGPPDTGKMMHGPELVIRHPAWTEANPYQDIPIMVFTQAQWREKEKNGLITSAYGADWGTFGSNARYVFKQPDRWIGYTDAKGQDELQALMSEHPLQAQCGKIREQPRK